MANHTIISKIFQLFHTIYRKEINETGPITFRNDQFWLENSQLPTASLKSDNNLETVHGSSCHGSKNIIILKKDTYYKPNTFST